MASESEMEPTQTQSQSSQFDTNGEMQQETFLDVWGTLKAKKHYELKDYDLSTATFTAGRLNSHSCCFAKSLPNKILLQLSKTHFKLTKDLSDSSNPVYIEDCSRNGTYVNNKKIGQGNKRILIHNDVIAVVQHTCKVFTFHNSHRNSIELPVEINAKYHVVKKLGSGACGTVFLVYDCITCQPMALKQIKKRKMNDYKKNRAKSEGDIMKAIKHPCVVALYDFDDNGDSIYITMEVMKGGDLLTRIQTHTYLNENISKLFIYQMCHAIKYLHDRGIAHRDLKPDNILLASNESETLVKISDFGLSKLCRNNSLLITMCGTPNYVAPEVLLTQGRRAYSKKVDIWSLGVVLYTCLSGTLPFSNDYGSPATEQITNGNFRFRARIWESVSSTAKKLVRQLLTVDVDKRLSIEQLLNHEWFNDYEMKCKAHKIMNIAEPPPPPPPSVNIAAVNMEHNFTLPYKVEEIRPMNDENAQPMKRRRIN